MKKIQKKNINWNKNNYEYAKKLAIINSKKISNKKDIKRGYCLLKKNVKWLKNHQIYKKIMHEKMKIKSIKKWRIEKKDHIKKLEKKRNLLNKNKRSIYYKDNTVVILKKKINIKTCNEKFKKTVKYFILIKNEFVLIKNILEEC